jgi:hypothetical protein
VCLLPMRENAKSRWSPSIGRRRSLGFPKRFMIAGDAAFHLSVEGARSNTRLFPRRRQQSIDI